MSKLTDFYKMLQKEENAAERMKKLQEGSTEDQIKGLIDWAAEYDVDLTIDDFIPNEGELDLDEVDQVSGGYNAYLENYGPDTYTDSNGQVRYVTIPLEPIEIPGYNGN